MLIPSDFKTPRLLVQSWQALLSSKQGKQALVEQLEPILTAPVLEHLPPSLHLAGGSSQIRRWIEDRAAEAQVLTVRDTGEALLGLLLLAHDPEEVEPPVLHLGYLLSQAAWGQGYGTELIAGLVAWYRDQAKALRLQGGVGAANASSARVLIKNGFVLNLGCSGPETQTYALDLPAGDAGRKAATGRLHR